MGEYRYLFGPVPSRRFGWSLGVDPVVMKTCSQNCVFCQLGSEAHTVIDRREYVPFEAITGELRRWKKDATDADVITLAGSGEPTLHSRFGDLIDFVQRETEKPCVLLTNGGLLYQPDVCNAAARADIVKVTLSAWDEDSYRRIHRPHEELTYARLLEGEQRLRQICKGQFWVEVFLVKGINDHQDALLKMARAVNELSPDQVHVNTVVRPPAESCIHPADPAVLAEAASMMGEQAEVVATFSKKKSSSCGLTPMDLLSSVTRHPGSITQLAAAFGVGETTVLQMAEQLVAEERIDSVKQDGVVFYTVRKRKDGER